MNEINFVKVFSATKARDRELLGERVTEWIAKHGNVGVVDTIIELTSDLHFHCLSIIMLCVEHSNGVA